MSESEATQELEQSNGAPKTVASFETKRARIVGHTYKGKDHVFRITLEVPADPAFATAMLKMRNEMVHASLEYAPVDETPSMFGEDDE